MTTRVAVVSAGLSVPSSTRLLADRLVDATVAALRSAGHDVTVDVVELRTLAHPLADHLLTGFPGEELSDALRTVADSDAVIAVTPVFSASYSGLFKTFFDVLEQGALDGKPVLLGATAGTARHSLVLEHAMRPLFAYLKAVVVPTAVFAASEDFGGTGDGQLAARVAKAGAQLAALLAGPIRRTPDAATAEGSREPAAGSTDTAAGSNDTAAGSNDTAAGSTDTAAGPGGVRRSMRLPAPDEEFSDPVPFEELLAGR